MPELPEVETVCRGLKPHVEGEVIQNVLIRCQKLRYPLDPQTLLPKLVGQKILNLQRRAKYLLMGFEQGTLLIHLGMTGVMRILPRVTPAQKHDHVDIVLPECLMRFNDVRRFGAMIWLDDSAQHPLLAHLGPEPLSIDFNVPYFAAQLKTCRRAIKLALMDQKIVVGVGNIYANEALFAAKIHPQKPAHLLKQAEIEALIEAVKRILAEAIDHGGTSLKDFLSIEGKPGYFRFALKVYAKKAQPCAFCETEIQKIVLGQRATYFCPQCQNPLEYSA